MNCNAAGGLFVKPNLKNVAELLWNRKVLAIIVEPEAAYA